MCGGCDGKGAYSFRCPRNPDYDHRLVLADQAEDLGDAIGPNNMAAANHCYAAAGLLRKQAKGEE